MPPDAPPLSPQTHMHSLIHVILQGISTVKQLGAALNDTYKQQGLDAGAGSGAEGAFDLKSDYYYKCALQNLRDSVMGGGR